jgi:heme-degrading monooxygenase HmoA
MAEGLRYRSRGTNLIVRILKGRVAPEQVELFRARALGVLEDMRTHPGLVHAEVARQVHSDGGEEIAFVSVWRNFDAIYGWLGVTNLLDTPMKDHGEEVLGDFEVQHYEALDPDELVLPVVQVASPYYADGAPRPAVVGRLGG